MSSQLLGILGIPDGAVVMDCRAAEYFVATAEDFGTRSNGMTKPVILRKSHERNRPICEEILKTRDLGDILCVVVADDRYGRFGAALFFSKTKETRSLVEEWKNRSGI